MKKISTAERRMRRYGWIIGAVCMSLGLYRLYDWIAHGDWVSAVLALFLITVSVFNVVANVKFRRWLKEYREA